MDDDMNEYLKAVQNIFKELGKEQPDAIQNFRKFNQAVKKDGALTSKTKELIGIAISLVKQCKFCIAFHVANALNAGATREEIIEACMVAVAMDGGPSLMFSNHVLKAIEDFNQ
jgi:AhpD family alkylhydroperoxidase